MSERNEVKTVEDREDREVLMDGVIERAISAVNQIVWVDAPLSAAESRLVWLLVVERLVRSAAIDRQSEVIQEWMGL